MNPSRFGHFGSKHFRIPSDSDEKWTVFPSFLADFSSTTITVVMSFHGPLSTRPPSGDDCCFYPSGRNLVNIPPSQNPPQRACWNLPSHSSEDYGKARIIVWNKSYSSVSFYANFRLGQIWWKPNLKAGETSKQTHPKDGSKMKKKVEYKNGHVAFESSEEKSHSLAVGLGPALKTLLLENRIFWSTFSRSGSCYCPIALPEKVADCCCTSC